MKDLDMPGNTDMTPDLQDRLLSFAVPIWFLLICVAVVGSFTHLGASSLWLDELFTVHLADSTLVDFKTFLARASEDVHPPGYYTLVWITGRLTGGDMAIVARGVSAAAATIMLVVLYFTMPPWVSRPARVFGCTLAATSAIFYIYTQEARSYTLSWVMTAALVGLVFVIVHRARAQGPVSLPLLAFTLFGIIAGLSHAYLIPLSGAMVIVMLGFARSWAHRAGFALAGITILIADLAYIRWHADKIASDVTKHWYRADFGFIWQHTESGINSVRGSEPEEILTTALILLGTCAAAWMWRKGPAPNPLDRHVTDVTLIVATSIISIALVLLITLTYTPSYSSRFFLVLAPLYWMLCAFLFEALLRSQWKWPILALTVLATAAFALLSIRITWRDIPRKQTWRETAHFVQALPGCENATLPVVTFTQTYITASEPVAFYGHYFQNAASRDWLAYPRDKVKAYPGTGPARDLVERRINGSDPCPLLLWREHHAGKTPLEAARLAMLKDFSLPEGTSIVLKTFSPPEHSWLMRYLNVGPQVGGDLLLLQRLQQAGEN